MALPEESTTSCSTMMSQRATICMTRPAQWHGMPRAEGMVAISPSPLFRGPELSHGPEGGKVPTYRNKGVQHFGHLGEGQPLGIEGTDPKGFSP